MGNRLDIKTGDRYNRLTIIREVEPQIIKNFARIRRRFECKCDCGNIWIGNLFALRNGTTKSCGCYNLEKKTTHNKKHTKEYRVWLNMKTRCYNPKDISYKNYGGRGIRVCDRWINSFENFYTDIGPKPNPEYSIDRIDVNGNYEPSNCKWSTIIEQNMNRRNVRHKSKV
jgi:hypothetical protein